MVNSTHSSGARFSALSRFVDMIVTARERQARSMVNQHLLTLDDATLKASGIDRSKIIRSQRDLIG